MKNENEVALSVNQDIIECTQLEVRKRIGEKLAVFIVKGMLFGENDDAGILKEIEEIPMWFEQADEITVIIVLADRKEPVTVHLFYE